MALVRLSAPPLKTKRAFCFEAACVVAALVFPLPTFAVCGLMARTSPDPEVSAAAPVAAAVAAVAATHFHAALQ